jgi:hypothetical protein
MVAFPLAGQKYVTSRVTHYRFLDIINPKSHSELSIQRNNKRYPSYDEAVWGFRRSIKCGSEVTLCHLRGMNSSSKANRICYFASLFWQRVKGCDGARSLRQRDAERTNRMLAARRGGM